MVPVGIATIFGNSLVLLVIGSYQSLRENLSTLLIGVLVISDLIMGEQNFLTFISLLPSIP
jgi:hypothetical protein